jgi:hypothetical protein
MLGLLALGAALAGIAVWVLQRPAAAPAVPSANAAAPPAPPAPAAGPFTLSIDSEPSGASVSEGNVVLGSTPLNIALQVGSGPRTFQVEKPGYLPYQVNQESPRGDVRVLAALSPVPAAAPSNRAPAPAAAPAPVRPRPAPAKPSAEKPKSPSDIRLER